MSKSHKKITQIESKSVLARLMARENISVVHSAHTKTAYFDLKDRVVTLPIMVDMHGYIYDAFIAHEIAHALYTPAKEYMTFEKTYNVPTSFLNVTEDVRIEKLIVRKYPGVKFDFIKFYTDMNKRDFFNLKKYKAGPASLVDEINLKAKLRNLYTPVLQNDTEKEIFDRAMAIETFDDAVKSAIEIYEYMKQNQAESLSKMTSKSEEDDDVEEIEIESDVLTEEELRQLLSSTPNDDPSGKKVKITIKGKDTPKKENQSNQGGSGDSEESEESEDEEDSSGNNKKRKKKITIKIDPTSQTQNNFNKNQSKTLILENPKKDTTFVVYNSKDHRVKIDDSFTNKAARSFSIDKNNSIDREWNSFRLTYKPVVNSMINRFNMKRAAKDYARTQESVSGKLNMKKIHQYKFNDNLMLKNQICTHMKNHGFVIMVDLSGSMSTNIKSTLMQTWLMMEFCTKVKIPFIVRGFTTGSDSNLRVNENRLTSTSDCCVIYHMFDNRMSSKDIEKRMLELIKAFEFGKVSMGGTPLCRALLTMDNCLEEFFMINPNMDKVSMILVTDGEAGDRFSPRSNNIYFTESKSGKNYLLKDSNSFHDFIPYLRYKYNLRSVLGLYISDGRYSSNAINPYVENTYRSISSKGFDVIENNPNFEKYFVADINSLTKNMKQDIGSVQHNPAASMIFMRMVIDEIV